MVLRVYQPTNATRRVDVTVPGIPSQAKLVTATETAWSGGGSVTSGSLGIIVTMPGAVATVEIPGMGLRG